MSGQARHPYRRLRQVRTGAAALFLVYALAAMGFRLVPSQYAVPTGVVFGWLIVALQAVCSALELYRMRFALETVRQEVVSLIFVVLSLLLLWSHGLFLTLMALFCTVTTVSSLLRLPWFSGWVVFMQRRPALVTVGGFVAIICLGTILLSLPSATLDQRGASLVDALFTSTSATCVTGLVVMNTAPDVVTTEGLQTFSRFGQVVILILIQTGGLGIMTLSAAFLLFMGGALRLRSREALGSLFDEPAGEAVERVMVFIIKMTFIIESIGAGILFTRFRLLFSDLEEAIYASVFHSVSAFCNAGFSLFGDSLVRFKGDPVVCLTLSALIVLGGLGYSVVAILFSRSIIRRRDDAWRKWGFHTKIVLVMTASLILVGAVLFFWLEYYHSMNGMSLGERLLASLFQSVTTRTAGFNSVDLSLLHHSTLFAVLILMFIGASPGGTGGGVKTTTVAVLALAIKSTLNRRKDVELWGSRIDSEAVLKSVAILTLSFGMISLAFFVLLATEPGLPFRSLLFEVVSAFGTVGLSLGITPELSLGGKLILSLVMLVGRLGPLTMAMTLRHPEASVRLRFPRGRIAVG